MGAPKGQEVKTINDEFLILKDLYSKKNLLQSQIPIANQDIKNWDDAGKLLNQKDGALNEANMTLVNGTFVPTNGINPKTGNLYTNNDIHGREFLADNTINDRNGNVFVEPKTYRYYYDQKGAFNKELGDEYAKAVNNQTAWQTDTPISEQTAGALAGMIYHTAGASNLSSVLNVANTLYDKLGESAKADISGRFFQEIGTKYSDISKLGVKGESVYTKEENNAVQKALKGQELNNNELSNIITATAKYAALSIRREIPTYLKTSSEGTLKSGGKGSGKNEKITIVPEVGVDVNTNIRVPGESTTTLFPLKNITRWNFSQDPIQATVAVGETLNPETGVWEASTIGNTTVIIEGLMEGKNPINGKKQKWVMANRKEGDSAIPIWLKLTPEIQQEIDKKHILGAIPTGAKNKNTPNKVKGEQQVNKSDVIP
jgi:hypothetical protein